MGYRQKMMDDIYELSEGEQQLITIASIKEFLLNDNSLLQ